MISIGALLRDTVIRDAMFFGDDDKPVYARLPDGTLRQIDSISMGQIMTSAGPHDVIVLEVSEQTRTEV